MQQVVVREADKAEAIQDKEAEVDEALEQGRDKQ